MQVLTHPVQPAYQPAKGKRYAMTRIPLPATVDTAPARSKPLLQEINRAMGSVPNLFRIASNSPAALQGYLGLTGALASGTLHPATRERIALAVAQANGCGYCVAAHSYLGRNRAKLDADEILANRRGQSLNSKADVAVQFAVKLVDERGQVQDADVRALRHAGYTNSDIVEIIAHVALNTLTNYLNEALGTPIDFPVVGADAA
jgi:uncharacterized peroxidase-related enzyme